MECVKCQINLQLLPLKVHFFLMSAGLAPVTPYLPVIGRYIGFSGGTIGFIYAVMPLAAMFSKILFGGIADRFQIRKSVFTSCLIMGSFIFIPINYIPRLMMDEKVEVTCKNGLLQFDTSYKKLNSFQNDLVRKLSRSNETITCQVDCPSNDDWNKVVSSLGQNGSIRTLKSIINVKNLSVVNNILYLPVDRVIIDGVDTQVKCSVETSSVACDIRCESSVLNDCFEVRKEYNLKDAIMYYQFWMYFSLAVFGWMFYALIMTIGDAICFDILGKRRDLYGKQRVWGAIGRGVFSIIGGLMIDAFSKDISHPDYISVFILMLALLLSDAIITTIKFKISEQSKPVSIIKDIGKLVSHIDIVMFLFWCMLNGIFITLLWNYVFIRIEELAEKHPEYKVKTKTLQGLVMGIRALCGEIPFFFISGWIIKKLGHMNCITLVFFVYGVRFLIYSLLENPWWMLSIEFLNGFTLALFYTTMVSYANIITPPGTEATTQGLVTAAFDGIGICVGNLIAGYVLEKFGSVNLFRSFSAAAFLSCVLQFIEQRIGRKYYQRYRDNRNAIE